MCRDLHSLLVEQGIDFDTVDFHVDPLSQDQIRELLARAGVAPREALRVKEEAARELTEATDDEIVAAMAGNPVLLQRPIVVNGDRAVLARPVERVLEIL